MEVPPWLSTTTTNQTLTSEIHLFLVYVQATPHELELRKKLIEVYTKKLAEYGLVVKPFGSTSTQLFLPLSDIDLSIHDSSPNNINPIPILIRISQVLQPYIVEHRPIVVRATVPVVKVTDNITNLVLDISYSNSSGELVADFVKSKLVCDKRIGALVIILKTILSCYSMHLPAAGGVGTYALFVLVSWFLKTYDEQDLGSLLKECLKYYGLVFNADVHGVSVDGTFNRVECGWAQRLGTLAVKDPCDENNNITVNSFKWPTIKKLFAMSYNALYYTNHVNYPPQKSLLKRILKIPSEFEELRERWKGLSCKELELNDNRG